MAFASLSGPLMTPTVRRDDEAPPSGGDNADRVTVSGSAETAGLGRGCSWPGRQGNLTLGDSTLQMQRATPETPFLQSQQTISGGD